MVLSSSAVLLFYCLETYLLLMKPIIPVEGSFTWYQPFISASTVSYLPWGQVAMRVASVEGAKRRFTQPEAREGRATTV